MTGRAVGMTGQPARRSGLILGLSFLPLAVKAVDYAWIGGYVPLLVFLFFFGLIVAGRLRGGRAIAVTVKIWAIVLILWGVARLALLVMARLASLDEAYLLAQFTPWYVVLSLGHVALGVMLFRAARR